MTDTIRERLRQDAGSVEIPVLDGDDLIARGERRLRRRRTTAVLAAVAAVALVGVTGVVAGGAQHESQGPAHKPSRNDNHQRTVEKQEARPLVYAEGTTVHVGDKTVEAEKPVAFISATDDGAVYEATLDGTLWFTDGSTTSRIGTSGFTAAPTAHSRVVMTGASGSLVVWGDLTGRTDKVPIEFVVYDTSRRAEVARIPFTQRGQEDILVHIGEDRVYFTPDSGCWQFGDDALDPCKNPHLFRFEVASGETARVGVAEWYAEMGEQARIFMTVAQDGQRVYRPGIYFRQVGPRLVTTSPGGDAMTLMLTNGEEVRLRLPDGFTTLGHRVDASVIKTSQWLDDDHIVVWANGGGGDLPPQEGDLLVCELPDGICRVAVPRSSHAYVAP